MLPLALAVGSFAAGKKAETLARARAMGIAVPDGFVVLPDDEVDEVELLSRLDALGASAFAVRSSANLEDLPGASAAGVFLSLTAVARAGVRDAIDKVRASAFGEPALAYLGARGLGVRVRMAVLVQPQVVASRLGVLHTLPSLPLGPPDDDASLVAEERAAEEPEWGEVSACSVPVGSALGRGARRLAALVGGPADIEYAITEEGPVFLQARPLTAPPSGRDPSLWIAAVTDGRAIVRDAEHNPDPLSAAQASLVERINERTGLPRQRVLQGYLFVEKSNAQPPTASTSPFPRRLFEERIVPACEAALRPLEERDEPHDDGLSGARDDQRDDRHDEERDDQRDDKHDDQRDDERDDEHDDEHGDKRDDERDDEHDDKHDDQRDDERDDQRDHGGDGGLVEAGPRSSRRFDDERSILAWLDQALGAYELVVQRSMGELAPSLREVKARLDALLVRGLSERLSAHGALLAGTGGETLARDASLRALGRSSEAARPRLLAEHLARFGAYSPVWDVAVPPDDEARDRVLGAAAILSRAPSVEVRHQEALAEAERAARAVAGRLTDEDHRAFDVLLAEARAAVTLGEDDDALFFRAQRAVRRPLLALARRYVAMGRLSTVDQIFELPIEDVRAGRIDEGAAQASRQRRDAARHLDPPTAIRDGAPTWRGATSHDVLVGAGTSGRGWGRAYLLTELASGSRLPSLPPGAVLVARAILPSLTYLIPGAAGLITDHGGAFSHGATLARASIEVQRAKSSAFSAGGGLSAMRAP